MPSCTCLGNSTEELELCRWDKGYENCVLEDIPHKKLTAPSQAFKFGFETQAMPYGRDNIMKLDIIASGNLNAVVFWFDLELDKECSITSGCFLGQRESSN